MLQVADIYIHTYYHQAAEEHYKSAEAFLQCVDQANDEGVCIIRLASNLHIDFNDVSVTQIKKTLRMLYNDHNKAGKELQRKIQKLREEGKDPNQPHPPPPVKREQRMHGSVASSPIPMSRTSPQGNLFDSNYPIDESYMMLGQQVWSCCFTHLTRLDFMDCTGTRASRHLQPLLADS